MIHLYDGNNVMLRDLDKIGHERIGLRRRYEASNEGMHIWCWDGRGHNRRRQDIYPAYKGKRLPMAEDRFAQIHVFRECLQHSSAIQVECHGWEADDVIASLVHQFMSRQEGGDPFAKSAELKATVHTNDADYWQLAAYRGITLNGVKPLDCAPQHTPLYKATVGDSSDNIIGIDGFGPKTWAALTPRDRNALQRAVESQDLAQFAALPLPKRVLTKLADPVVRSDTAAALTITKFFPVPAVELDKGITHGTLNRHAADQLLRRFFL